MRRSGFAWTAPYTLGRGLPSPRGGYLPASLHRLTTTSSGRALHPPDGPEGPVGELQALSITRFGMGGSSPVPEYQPDVHRLRLSASP
jgi:hypothetical protein